MGLCIRKAGVEILHNVDLSDDALKLAARNYELNGIEPAEGEFQNEDVKRFLGNMPAGCNDLIVLDPPKFTASKRTIDAAIKGYKSTST